MPGPDLSNVPGGRLPLDRLLDVLPPDSPIREEALGQATFAPTGPEFALDDTTSATQQGVALARLADGTTLVIWNDITAGSAAGQIHGRFLDANGQPIGAEITLTNGAPVHFYDFEIAALDDGGFVLTWTTGLTTVDGSGQAIMAQMFDADGTPRAGAFQVNTQWWLNQQWPDVAALPGGGFVVTWMDQAGDYLSAGDPYGSGIRAQIYAADGTPVGGEIAVNSTTLGSTFYPTVATLDSGAFVITWTGFHPSDSVQLQIRAQVYSATGVELSTELSMNSDATVRQQHSDVAALSDGGFVVIWAQRDTDTGVESIRGQEFDAGLNPVGTEFVVQEIAGPIGVRPEVSAIMEGGVVVSWSQGALGDEEVYVRAFHDWDEPWTDAMPVNTEFDGRHLDAEVVAQDNGFIVAWLDGQGGSLAGDIEARNYDLMWV